MTRRIDVGAGFIEIDGERHPVEGLSIGFDCAAEDGDRTAVMLASREEAFQYAAVITDTWRTPPVSGAATKAWALLREHLDDVQCAELDLGNAFHVTGGVSGLRYRIEAKWQMNVVEVASGTRMCAVLEGVPLADQLLAQALLLSGPEEGQFLEAAASTEDWSEADLGDALDAIREATIDAGRAADGLRVAIEQLEDTEAVGPKPYRESQWSAPEPPPATRARPAFQCLSAWSYRRIRRIGRRILVTGS